MNTKNVENIILDIDDQIEDIKNWEEEYHLITTGSFLVCRCEGMITIKESAQRFDAVICHSYNDEMKEAMMSFLSLLSIKNAVLACGLAVYEIATMEDNPEGIVDGILAEADVLESLKEDGEGILTRLGAGRIAKMASIYGVVTNIINLFYVSYATWIENIKITVFTDTHAHVSKRTLNIIGELEAGEDIKFFSQFDYSTDQKGDGLKWKEEPGVYMRRWAHKGDNTNNKGVAIKDQDDVENGVGA